MKINTILACESVIRDAETNSPSLINLIDGINAESLPILLQKFTLFISSSNDKVNEIFHVDLVIKNNDIVVYNGKVSINFNISKKTRNIIRFNNFVVQTSGDISISILNDGEVLATTIIEVNSENKLRTVPPPPPAPVK